ncbi:hypothetical protein GCM10022221_34490 [Actinocorallia aurea]
MEQSPPPGSLSFAQARGAAFQGSPTTASGTCWWPPQHYPVPSENPTLRLLFDTPATPKGKRHRRP